MSCIELAKLDDHNGDIVIIYDAGGRQLKLTKTTPTDPTEIYHYHGGIEYKNGKRESISFGEGRVIYNGNLESTNGPLRIYTEWMMSDHLGNTRVRFVDKDGNGKIQTEEGATPEEYELSGSYHYYPFGMVMEGTFSEHQGVKNKYQYNGIEHMDFIGHGISLTTYRVHDAAVGRWWQVDQKAEGAKSQSPYNSMWNNPVSYSDPNGDFAILLGAAIGVGVNGIINNAKGDSFFQGAFGAALGGALSGGYWSAASSAVSGHLPSATISSGGGFTISLSPALAFGSNGFSVGANAGLGFSSKCFSAGIGGGIGYSNMSLGANSAKGFTSSMGGGATLGGSDLNLGLYTNSTRGAGIGQQVAGARLGVAGASITYENDGAPFAGSGLNDEKDRFRTNAVSIGYGGVDLRLNMFTGDSYGNIDTKCADCLTAGHPIEGLKTGDGDMYRLGALSLGYGGNRIGWNSEGIRHTFQNKFAHTEHNIKVFGRNFKFLHGQGYFRHLGGSGSYYSETSSFSNPYSLWSF